MLDVCLIGVSGFGETHYKDILSMVENGQARFRAATVINPRDEPEKCAEMKRMGCKIYSDYRAMLGKWKNKTDLCFIPTGIHMHKPMTVDALNSGMNVFVEKPAAATVQDVDLMIGASVKNSRLAAVGYQDIYQEYAEILKRALLDAVIGKVKTVKAYGKWPRYLSYYRRNNWAGKIKNAEVWILDSPFNNALAHFLNLSLFFAGNELEKSADIESVYAELYRAKDIENADTACIRIVSESGVEILFYASHSLSETEGPEIAIAGEKGSIVWKRSEPLIAGYHSGEEKTILEQNVFSREILRDKLCRVLEGGKALICTLDIARAHTLCVNGAHESSGIIPIPQDFVYKKREEDGRELTAVKDMETIIDKAFEEGKMFSEMGVPWAKTGKVIGMKNYNEFRGGRIYKND